MALGAQVHRVSNMKYQSRLKQQLLAFKAKNLPDLQDGTWSHRGTPKTYRHILPKDQFRLNILPAIRERFWEWFGSANPSIARHKFFHHLNSSQALAFNLFFPFVDPTTRHVDPRLLQALDLPADIPYAGEFEKVFDKDENTNFDFYLEGPAEHKVFFELKLSESEFGKCVDDERHCRKLEQHYRPYLTDHVESQWLEKDAFFKNYQVLRNLSYLGRHPDSRLVFIFPKANERLAASEDVIKRIASKSLAPRVTIVYLEALVERLLTATEDDAALHEHFEKLKEKYVVPSENA
jgi:hypothetical protein